jgi:HEPN domain-containing protein
MRRNNEEEAKRWLEQANYDLKTSHWNLKGDLFAPACFWAQQSAEKAAKAYLYLRGERVVIGHSVADLLERCKKYDKGFKPVIPIGSFLDRFYIPTRYPNGLPGGVPARAYRQKDALEAIRTAQKVLDLISQKLSTG